MITASVAGTVMSYKMMKLTYEAGEGINLGDAIWFVFNLIGVAYGVVTLAQEVKTVLTALEINVNIYNPKPRSHSQGREIYIRHYHKRQTSRSIRKNDDV